jgi:serine/threonine protein kinase
MGLQKGMVVQGMRGRYKVESLIGSGGLGRVWRATAADGSIVAVKEPLSEGPQYQVAVNFEKLMIEAIVLERLTGNRPMLLSEPTRGYVLEPSIREHIVRFIDVDRVNRPTTLVLEFVVGKSIDDEFRSATSADFTYVDEYSIQVLNIVRSLHQNNILHRDISPHNLIASPSVERDPVLIDFGTVKEGFNQLSVTGRQWSQIIKPGYSAPELSLGLASPSSDLYSVAATIMFMYTGINPQYLRNSSGELDEARKSELRRIPPERLTVLKKAMSYHPGDRFQTADDLLNALKGRATPPVGAPYIVASGRKFPIRSPMVVGKYHPQCGNDCRDKYRKFGLSGPPDIAVNDPERYVSRHHARFRPAGSGECYVMDLDAVSGTAIRHSKNTQFERLRPGTEQKLQDGDVVALAYSPSKGPYMTVSFHSQ